MPPFRAGTPVGVLTMHLTEDLVPPSERAPELNIPEAADRILAKTMRKQAATATRACASSGATSSITWARSTKRPVSDSTRLAGLGGGVAVPTDSGRQRELATRGDIDDYERRSAGAAR